MSYQVLARKWRPGDFSQVAGQEHVLRTLINALDNGRLHHAYLFTGTRGTGKTTLARILAKCFNCEQGVSSNPCNACGACREIGEGGFLDLYEIDAASRTKVEDTRELLENVQYAPAQARFKVYLIDEVHMLSTHSFNALLKTLEEPPDHVKFLFATTDPQKLPVTILSRCLQFHLKNLGPNTIVKYLGPVLEQEKIECEQDALWQIATAAGGSMRDALTLLDQAISYCQGPISAGSVVEMLGIPPRQQVFELLKAMASGDLRAVLAITGELAGQIPDYAQTLDSLLSTLHRLAIAQAFPEAIDNSQGDRREVIELAAGFSAEDLQLFYQIGNKGREELYLPGDMRSAFEMLLLRMLVFAPDPVVPVAQGDSGSSGGEEERGSRPEEELDAVEPEPEVREAAAEIEDSGIENPQTEAEIPEAAPINMGNGGVAAEEPPDTAAGLVAEFESLPNVQELVRNFSGKVIRESVTPSQRRGEQ
ncbi:MAG: DNA polymerase III subunit gamma/tau [Gammaproteobacteria bacterium]|nr:DNA polymerase III subunit gamma/tau [Gammaproteobacteria bacterium]